MIEASAFAQVQDRLHIVYEARIDRPDPVRPRRRNRFIGAFSGYLFGLVIVLLAAAVAYFQMTYS